MRVELEPSLLQVLHPVLTALDALFALLPLESALPAPLGSN